MRSVALEARGIKIKFGSYGAVRLLWLLSLPFLAVAVWGTARFGRADYLARENTSDSLREAVQLDPGNADFRELFAEHLAEDGLDPTPELRVAVSLSPLNSHWWDRLGFQAESDGDYPRAERDLMQAVRVDQTFGPRWALMNYYFRRGNARQFWRWTKSSLDMSFGDLTNIFRLCWMMSEDEALIRSVMPARKEILTQYLNFLTTNGHLDAAAPIATHTAELADSDDLQILTSYCDRSFGKGASAAETVWNILCRRKLLPFSELDPSAGHIVTNGDFRVEPTQIGFDWRAPSVEGAYVVSDPGGMTFKLSGKQPEDCILLFEPVPLSPGHEYRLSYKYRSRSEDTLSGLSWSVKSLDAPDTILSTSPDLTASGDWTTAQFTFAAGTHSAANLIFHYKRPLGKVRWQGEVDIGDVSPELVR
jgi:hypothetical protein